MRDLHFSICARGVLLMKFELLSRARLHFRLKDSWQINTNPSITRFPSPSRKFPTMGYTPLIEIRRW
jgi:hypothetical protein